MNSMRKRGLLSVILAAAASALLALGLCFRVLPASAAEGDVFDYNYLNNRTFVSGVAYDDVVNAFNEEGERLQQAIAEAGVGSFTVVNAPLGNGWPSANDTYFVAAHLDLEEYSCMNLWGHTGYALMVFNPHTKQAYTVKGEALAAYTNSANGWTNQIVHLGYPAGNDFTADGVTYQNFTLGYAKDGQTVYGKNVDENGTEYDLTADMIAQNMVVPVYQDTASESVIAGLAVEDFVNAYKEYYADKAVNTNAMSVLNNRANSIWRQETEDGGNVVYNSQRKQMFTVTSTFLTAYNGTTEWGNPVAEEATTQGVVNQLFTNGVAVLEEGGVSFYVSSHVDEETGDIVSDFDENAVGALNDNVAALLPANVTAAAVQAAVQAVWTSDMGNPTGNMEFFEDSSVLVQTFAVTDFSGGSAVTLTTQISLDVSSEPLSAAVLSSDTYALYGQPVRFNEGNQLYKITGEMVLGPAVSSEFTVGDKTYQNFLYGAMELSAEDEEDMVLPGVRYALDGSRTVLDLSSLIKIDASAIRIPQSYQVGAADLLAKFRAAYKEYIAEGYALGVPSVEGITAWPATDGGQESGTNEFTDGRGMIILGLYSTDSTAICYYGVTAYLAYNPEDGEIYLMKDAVVSNMASYYSTYGAPRCNLTETTLVANGHEVTVYIQNFQLGYLVVQGTAASMIEDFNWDFQLLGAVNLDGSKVAGTEYPGESADDSEGGNGGEEESKKGCGGTAAAGSLFACGAALAAAVSLLAAKKRRA